MTPTQPNPSHDFTGPGPASGETLREAPACDDVAFVETSLEMFQEAANPTVPWIATFARLSLEGVSMEECVELLGKPLESLRVMAGTTRFQTLLLQLAKRSGNDVTKKFLASQAMPSLVTLVAIRDSEETSATLRAKVCEDLLNRIFGKAPIVHQINTPDDLSNGSDDPVEVRRRLEAKVLTKLAKNIPQLRP